MIPDKQKYILASFEKHETLAIGRAECLLTRDDDRGFNGVVRRATKHGLMSHRPRTCKKVTRQDFTDNVPSKFHLGCK